jgi:hypothetical protein
MIGHAKAPPELSDGVTLFNNKRQGMNAPASGISPGAP